jgi:hypothetical protein
LHALSEVLDSAMASNVDALPISRSAYVRAWQRAGRAPDRARQIELTLSIGGALDRYTHNALLRHTLRMMRRPARAAGLAALQTFLESGFDTFGAMRGAQEFLAIVADRERALAERLFGVDAVALEMAGRGKPNDDADPLGQLP